MTHHNYVDTVIGAQRKEILRIIGSYRALPPVLGPYERCKSDDVHQRNALGLKNCCVRVEVQEYAGRETYSVSVTVADGEGSEHTVLHTRIGWNFKDACAWADVEAERLGVVIVNEKPDPSPAQP